MPRQVRIRFERGGELTAVLLDDLAPQTCQLIWEALPLQSTVLHTRWCGREVNWRVEIPKPPAENWTTTASMGNLVYWREWEGHYPSSGLQALALYYGAELIRDHRGLQPVNVFGQVDSKDWTSLAEIGERIWRRGQERLEILPG